MLNFYKILTLGGSGFIGKHLQKYIKFHFSEIEVEDVSFPSIDFVEKVSISNIFSHYDSQTILNLLAATKRQQGDSLEFFHRNLQIVEYVATAAAYKPPAGLVFINSAADYGEEIHNLAIQETTSVQPQTYYGLYKFTGEHLLDLILGGWARQHLLTVRPP